MEILIISHKYPPSIGGMQKQCLELVKGLKKYDNVHKIIYKEGSSKILFLLLSPFRLLNYLRQNPNIDIVYANDGLMAFFLNPVVSWIKQPFIVTLHGLDVVFPFRLYQRWLSRSLSKMAGVIAVSEGTREEIVKRSTTSQNVFLVPNGCDKKENLPRVTKALKKKISEIIGLSIDERQILISLGRGVKRKGFSWAINNLISQLSSNVIYIIVGPPVNLFSLSFMKKWLPKSIYNFIVLLNGLPTDEVEISEAIKQKDLEDRVFRISGLNQDELIQLLSLADIFLMPNQQIDGDFEGFGLVALEAVTAGTLCIAANTDGIATAIQDGENGILMEPGDKKQWYSTLQFYLQNEEILLEKSKLFRDNTMKVSSSWQEMADNYRKIFLQIADHKMK